LLARLAKFREAVYNKVRNAGGSSFKRVMMLDEELIKLGLSEKEAKVYLGAIQLGASTVQKISQKSQVNRATTYVIIESLMRMGLMSTFEEGRKTFYVAEKPRRLVEFYKNKKTRLDEKIERLSEIVPELNSLYNDHSDRPRVKYYEGSEGLLAIYDDFESTLSGGQEILIFTPIDDFKKIKKPQMSQRIEKFRDKRLKKGVRARTIYSSASGRDEIFEESIRKLGEEILFLEKDKSGLNGLDAGLNVYGNKVFLFSYQGKRGGVLIESQSVANLLGGIFEIVWSHLKSLKK